MSDPTIPTPPPPAPPAAALPVAPPPPPPPPPAASFGPPPRQGIKTPAVVGIVVGIVALVGGGAALANSLGSEEEKPERSKVADVTDDDNGGIDPNDGPAPPPVPSTVPTPGPQPAPPVTTTTAPSPSPNPVGGRRLDVGSGVSIVVADGWQVVTDEPGVVGMVTEEGGIWVKVVTGATSATDVLTGDLLSVSSVLEQVELGEVVSLEAPSAVILEGYGIPWTGIRSDPQTGSMPVEGVTLAYLRSDELGIAITQLNEAGAWPSVEADVSAMIASIEYGG